MLLIACRLVLQNLLFSSSQGKDDVFDIFDEQFMYQLFEKFILNYYSEECKEFNEVYSKQIKWAITKESSDEFLPNMQSDIYIRREKNVLIIDAKYYDSITTSRYGRENGKFHSSNLYQIYTYVKNEASNHREYKICGLLMYAKPDDSEIHNCHDYYIDGNRISVMPLDLSGCWKDVVQTLNFVKLNFL